MACLSFNGRCMYLCSQACDDAHDALLPRHRMLCVCLMCDVLRFDSCTYPSFEWQNDSSTHLNLSRSKIVMLTRNQTPKQAATRSLTHPQDASQPASLLKGLRNRMGYCRPMFGRLRAVCGDPGLGACGQLVHG